MSQALTITHVRRDLEREAATRPLDFGLIRRLIGYMRPYAAKRNWLTMCVIARAIQLPCIAWATGMGRSTLVLSSPVGITSTAVLFRPA